MLASEGVPPQLTALKRQHAEHLLEVVRFAEKQEAERQNRLRHATSKFSIAYLQKRFDTERRQNQTQISQLIQDAHAVEAAMRKAAGCPPEQEHRQNGPGNQHDYNRLRPNSVSGEGGGGNASGGGGCGGGGLSGGGRGSTSECNAFIELPEPGGGDSRFISAKQARFMEYVHKREDSRRLPRAPVGFATKTTGVDHRTGERRMRLRHRQSGGSGDGGDNQAGGGPAALRAAAAASAKPTDKSLPLPRRGQGGGGAAVGKSEGVRGASPLPHGTGRRRLLAEKRGILLELKSVVNRQAEALDRLVDSCGDTLGGVRSRGGVGGGSGGSGGNGGSRCSRGSKFGGWDSGGSSRSSATERGRYSQTSRGGNTSWAERVAAVQGAPCYDNVRAKQRAAAGSPATTAPARGEGKGSFPPRPPESGTSAFLARGGRWGGEGGTRVSGRNSVASSASYATYANKGQGRRDDAFGVCRRPAEVPSLLL